MNTNQHHHRRLFTLSLHTACALVVGLTIGGFYLVVFQPLERMQASYVENYEQLDLLLLKTGTEASDYRQLRNELNTMKQAVAEVRHQLANESAEATIIQRLGQIATDVNLEILDYQRGLTKTLPEYSQTEVELSCQGSYGSICHFLEKAEQITKITKLSRFELNSEENSQRYPIQLTFVLYSAGKSHDTKKNRGQL